MIKKLYMVRNLFLLLFAAFGLFTSVYADDDGAGSGAPGRISETTKPAFLPSGFQSASYKGNIYNGDGLVLLDEEDFYITGILIGSGTVSYYLGSIWKFGGHGIVELKPEVDGLSKVAERNGYFSLYSLPKEEEFPYRFRYRTPFAGEYIVILQFFPTLAVPVMEVRLSVASVTDTYTSNGKSADIRLSNEYVGLSDMKNAVRNLYRDDEYEDTIHFSFSPSVMKGPGTVSMALAPSPACGSAEVLLERLKSEGRLDFDWVYVLGAVYENQGDLMLHTEWFDEMPYLIHMSFPAEGYIRF